VTSKLIGCIHKGQVGKRWSPREKAHRYGPEGKSCNALRSHNDMRLQAEFLPEPTKEDWPFSVQCVRAPLRTTGEDNSSRALSTDKLMC